MSRILYVSHDVDQPRGGIGVLYDHVAALRANGFDAFIVHATKDFRYPFAQRDVPVLHAGSSFKILKTDVLVVPEDYAPVIKACRDLGCRKVLFCQNHFLVFQGIAPGESWREFGFTDYLCVSTPIREVMKRWFDVSASIVRPCIDRVYFSERVKPIDSPIRLACMPRKGGVHNLRLVQGLLASDGFSHRAELIWCEIDGLPKEQVAARLQDAHIYVSTSVREGLGLPPLEAMAAGCLVVGFMGGGGVDYASSENGVWVDDEDPWALAEAIEQTVAGLRDPNASPSLHAKRAAGQATALNYNRQQFERDLIAFWTALLQSGG
ncbi:MAG: glycosyltransferase [Pseudomonadota bacterium]|nr:glycosyltransferase [Pseudomonadota bacterium]